VLGRRSGGWSGTAVARSSGMTKPATRRAFLGVVGSGLLMVECKSRAPDEGPPASAPRENDVQLEQGAVMPKRRLGRTGEQVSLLGIGGYHLGVPESEDESIRIIRFAIDHGVTFLDNCWDYHEGKSEIRMGKALRDGYRQKAFLMSKIDGRTKDSAARQIDQSLMRLQTDVIDLMQIHEIIRPEDPARCFGPGGTMEAMLEAKKAGKIRFIGFTGHKDPAIHLAMLNAGFEHEFTFDTVQMPLNVMDPHFKSFERKVLPVLGKNDIGVLGMKPLGSGDILKSGVVSARECLHYAMSLPTSVVITGCDSMGVLKQALDAVYGFRPLSKEQTQALLGRTAPHARAGEFERFKTSERFDGTVKNPHWLESARI
jgi:predicted aldo/keto reductase-like oxidoreductase